MKVDIRYLILASLPLFMPADLYCQKVLFPEYNPPDIRWDNFLLKGGEASQESICLLIDSKGFLWSGNESGLFRFDGARYVEYGVSADSTGFAGYTVTNIYEDSEGIIWVGTSGALNRLDQATGTFRHFFPDMSSKSAPGNYIRLIREDRDGLMWILTRKDIYSFDRKNESFTRFVTDSLSWYPVESMFVPEDEVYAEDSSGNKWFVTYRGLYLFNKRENTFRMILPDSVIPDMKDVRSVKCINKDNEGNIWIGTDGAGLLKWNNVQNKPEKIMIHPEGKYGGTFNAISSVLPDKNGSVWGFGHSSFSNYNPGDKSVRNYIFMHKDKTVYEQPGTDIWINETFQSGNGTIWFLNKYAGLMFRFDPQTEKLCTYRVPNFIAYQCVMDRYGSFWFACIRNNIHRLVTDNIPYLTFPVNNSSHVAQIHRGAFLEDNNNRVYLLLLQGTYVFNKFDVTSSLVLNRFRFPDGDTIAGGGFQDSKGNLWFGNKKGNIARFNPSTKALTYLTNNYSPGNNDVVFVPLVREDKNGNIWIANNHSLFRFNRDLNKLDHILDFKFRPQNQEVKLLNDFLIDAGGNLWILISDSILNIRLPEMKVTEYGIPGDSVFKSNYSNIRLAKDSKGNLFILNSRYGLYRFIGTEDAFVRFDLTGEDPGSEYYDLLIDRKDKFWIAYNRGIKVINPQDKSSRLIKMPQLQFDVQSCQIKSGHILFLNFNQLYIFEENPLYNNNIPPVYLTRLLVNGKEYHSVINQEGDTAQRKKLNLPYRMNTISIDFAALNYLNPEMNRYRYFMTKRDKDTVTVSEGESADYKTMPPGRYRFWVTGSNNDGLWNPSGVSLDIRIHPPWFSSVVAFISYLLFLLMLIGAYIRKRTYNLRRDKIRLEAEVKGRTSELELKNRQLAEIDRIKTHFFTNISHEIRTPLSLILGPLENISREEMLSSRMSGMVEMMKKNAQRLMHLINQLLDISRLDAGKMKIILAEDDIVKCIRILVYEFLSIAESKQITYIADLPEKDCKTYFDRDKIEKVISNLLSNAFKYTREKGTVQCIVKIESDIQKNSKHFLQIKVVDSGPGISKENQSRIFDRFFRVEGHSEAEGHGTGIGLSLVQEFVSLLHGEIYLESTPGTGSAFSVTLPLGKDHLSVEEYVVTQLTGEITDKQFTNNIKIKYDPGSVRKDDKGKMRILIVEDNEDLRKYIRQSLHDDYNIQEAGNGKAGVNLAFTMMPDLIVTDIMMPDLDGINLCAQLKNDERTSHIPIIMLTAKATADDRITGLKSGADDYIVKPFSMAELRIRISNLLALRDKIRMKYDRFHILEIPESVDDKFMSRVLKIINANLVDYDFDVGLLQEQIGMSKTHLTRKLKILTGLPPGTLIRNIRLEKAAEFLAQNTGNITEIANSVGISNPSNFTRAFRNYFGVSPKEYSRN